MNIQLAPNTNNQPDISLAPVSSPMFVNGTPTWVQGIIQRAAQQYNVPPIILSALLKQESGFNPNAISPVGAQGIAQFMPGTARGRGVNPLDPESSIMGAAKYLREGLDKYNGDIKKTLAAYNAGFGAVDQYGGIPPYQETQNYVKSILAAAGEPHESYNGPFLSFLNDMKDQSQNNTGFPAPSGTSGSSSNTRDIFQPQKPNFVNAQGKIIDTSAQQLPTQISMAPQQSPIAPLSLPMTNSTSFGGGSNNGGSFG